MERHTFRKAERLCSRTRIKLVLSTGKAVSVPPFRLIGTPMRMEEQVPAQIAFAVPRRNLRRAVDRNRMKRLMRESYRLNKGRFIGRLQEMNMQCAWLFVFQGKATIPFAEVEHKICAALDRWMEKHV